MSHPLDKDGDFLVKWIEKNGHKSLSSENEYFDVLKDAKRVIERVDTFQPPQVDKEALLVKINSEITHNHHASSKWTWKYMILGTIILLGLASAIYTFINNEIQVDTPHGKKLEHILPDKSDVILNANSHMAYNSDFTDKRKLKLKGEAFFNVEKGSSFIVETDLGEVEVLGTSFNVLAQKNAFKVSCKTGRVKVTIKEVEYMLTPGKEILYFQGRTERNNIQLDLINQWENDISSFENTPLPIVIKSLEDWYGIEVSLDSKYNFEEFTGGFVHDDIEKALKMVFLPMNLKYELKDNNLVLIQD